MNPNSANSPQLRSRRPHAAGSGHPHNHPSDQGLVKQRSFSRDSVGVGGDHSMTRDSVDRTATSSPLSVHRSSEEREGKAERDGDNGNTPCEERNDDYDDDRGEEGGDLQPLISQEGEEKVKVLVEEEETWLSIMLQVLLPYIIAGFGMVAAGMVLDLVQVGLTFPHCCLQTCQSIT